MPTTFEHSQPFLNTKRLRNLPDLRDGDTTTLDAEYYLNTHLILQQVSIGIPSCLLFRKTHQFPLFEAASATLVSLPLGSNSSILAVGHSDCVQVQQQWRGW